jgi:hypothetical protein
MKIATTIILTLSALSCANDPSKDNPGLTQEQTPTDALNIIDSSTKSIHVFVALCDNKYQGIVPVNAKVGNGQDPSNNLYWGWGYGVKTYFKNSKEWTFIKSERKTYPVLERLLFKNKNSDYYLIADAYDGRNMKDCVSDYLKSAAGIMNDTVIYSEKNIGINGNSRLLVFVGHNGLMDFQLNAGFNNADKRKRDCIILACYSKNYFMPFLKQAGANPVLWTTNLMGPEAYTVHDALSGYVKGESTQNIQQRAADAYSKYAKCSVKAAKNLLVTGW